MKKYILTFFFKMVIAIEAVKSILPDRFDGIPSLSDLENSKITHHRHEICIFKERSPLCFMDENIPDSNDITKMFTIEKFIKESRSRVKGPVFDKPTEQQRRGA